jgi:hypothetical protein
MTWIFLTGSHQKEFVPTYPYKIHYKVGTFAGDKEEAVFVSSFFYCFCPGFQEPGLFNF